MHVCVVCKHTRAGKRLRFCVSMWGHVRHKSAEFSYELWDLLTGWASSCRATFPTLRLLFCTYHLFLPPSPFSRAGEKKREKWKALSKAGEYSLMAKHPLPHDVTGPRTPLKYCLKPCFSEWCVADQKPLSQPSTVWSSITWELVKNADSQPPPDLLHLNLPFLKTPRVMPQTLKLKSKG